MATSTKAPSPPSSAVPTERTDIEPTAHETSDRIATGIITTTPFLALIFVMWQLTGNSFRWWDVALFLIFYLITGLGITVGFHRLFTHRSFKAPPAVRAALAIMGSAAVEGPIISWVADHRKHHRFSDMDGDPHSPHGHGGGFKGALIGLWHSHMGWLFNHTQRGLKTRYAPDLLADPVIRFVDRTFLLWALLGLALPFGIGYAIGGTFSCALTAFLWGGAARMFVLHQMTYSINSICHFFGRQRFDTGDHSRNVFWLALPSFGEAWHNNHHAFPTSAKHGLHKLEFDFSALVISLMKRIGLAQDVITISAERQEQKLSKQKRGSTTSSESEDLKPPVGRPTHTVEKAASG